MEHTEGSKAMPRLLVFNSVTLDGYFTGENGDLSWAHTRDSQDEEWKAFVSENAKGGGVLLFGRVTYDMMASYWPTPDALRDNPVVAERMNALPKIVFSRSLTEARWNNTKLAKGEPATEIRRLKQAPGADLVLMGSGTIVSQLAQEGLVDEYQFVVVPVALGKGRTMFEGVQQRLAMRPTQSRTFRNGRVLLCYEPKA
jgi:dihydrofolate reductase